MNLCTRLLKKCWMPLAILMITMAILFSLFRALTPWAKQYKGEVERHLSTLIGQPVVINSMETSWYWLEPVLRLNEVTVSDANDHVLKFNKLLVGINLLSSLWHWHIQPGILYVDDVHLTLRQVNDRWQVDGLRHDKQVTLEPALYMPVLGWILGQQKIIIKNVSAMVHLNDGSLVPLSELNLTATNSNGHYRLRGHAKLAQTMATELSVLADMKINPYALSEVSGRAYFAVHRLLPMQWQPYFPTAQYHLEGGKGDIEAWLDVSKGHFSGIQTKVDFHRLAFSKIGNPNTRFIQSMRANLAWKPTREGWEMSGDQIKLRADGLRWPENAFKIYHNQSQQSYRLFIQALLLEPLLAEKDVQWPPLMQPVMALHPRGQLHDTQINIKDGQVEYVLTRFSELGWEGHDQLPSVSNLSGVLSWQPSEGRLEIDGENTIIKPRGYKELTFTQANAAFEWKELSHGLRISMDHFILNHADFLFSARGALDEPFTPSARSLRLSAEFSAENATQWLPYIPSHFLKAKLEDWLKHDIKRIDKASGQLTINGLLADFPFDKQPGEFTLVSRLSGVDLFFNTQWPICRDIDAYMHINKRAMEVDVLQADFQGVAVDKVNFNIADLGMDRETLILHGKVDAPSPKVMDYILASPLKKRLGKLTMLDIDGSLGLDLRLEVPLYPENNDVLARGDLTFNNNQVMFHHAVKDVELGSLSGVLKFDEHGVTNSELNATLHGDPVAIRIQSISTPKPHTEVTIEGNTTIDLLRERFDLPDMPFVHGPLKIESQLLLTDNVSDTDHIHLSTSLEGVGIALPKPFGKSSAERAPLTVDIDVSQQKALRFRFNYDNRLSSDLWFASSNGSFILDKGEIRMGNGQAQWKKKPGIQIVGSLPEVDLKQWREIAAKMDSTKLSPGLLDKMNGLDMTLGNITFWGQNYPKVDIYANKVNKDEWTVSLEQRDIVGDLRYQRSSNTLSGQIERLYLSKSALIGKTNSMPNARLRPEDIPNLNITIDDFKLDDVDVGNIALKSMSTDKSWHLDQCKITTPDYKISMKGDWVLKGKQNNTTIEAQFQTANLGKALQRWHMMPAVEAHQADIQFNGSWPGAINDFSLAKLNGHVYMMLQNGRITHLSPETENKLGLGKLLSILSLQTIPRRLKLDFSDLANDGYTYDVFKGTFALVNGVMNTTDSYIDGPVAYASMKGDLDLVKQLYDLDLHVSPHITASLPIVATIVGTPIAGMATWVASKLIDQGMQKVTGYTYKVSGPWLNPIVQQVSILKKKPNP